MTVCFALWVLGGCGVQQISRDNTAELVAFFIAPEPNLKRTATAIVAATALMGVALVAVTYFVAEIAFGTLAACVAGLAAALACGWSWFRLHP